MELKWRKNKVLDCWELNMRSNKTMVIDYCWGCYSLWINDEKVCDYLESVSDAKEKGLAIANKITDEEDKAIELAQKRYAKIREEIDMPEYEMTFLEIHDIKDGTYVVYFNVREPNGYIHKENRIIRKARIQ